MRYSQLTYRMVICGAILFAFYAALVAYFQQFLSLPIVVVGTVSFAVLQYAVGKSLALRSVGAEELSTATYPHVHREVERLCTEMEIEKPKLRLARMGLPNAFAVGRRGAGVVVVSEMLLEVLDDEELVAVLAHELAHVKNRDAIMMVLGQSIASMFAITIFWLFALTDDSAVAAIIGWLLSTVVQLIVTIFVMVISRYREYVADRDAAKYTNRPDALARALVKIDLIASHEAAPELHDNVGPLCISGGKRGLLNTIFRTHPPTDRRIEELAPAVLDRREQILQEVTQSV